MKPYIVKSTPDTPAICLNKDDNKFLISGASLPENIFEFYDPVFDWFNEYIKNPNCETNIELKFEYLNSSSTKIIHNILHLLEKLINEGNKVNVFWYFDVGDAEMREVGQDFQEDCKIPFNFKQI